MFLSNVCTQKTGNQQMEPFELERLSFPKHDKLNFEYGEGEDSMEPLSIYRYNDFVIELVIF